MRRGRLVDTDSNSEADAAIECILNKYSELLSISVVGIELLLSRYVI